MPADRFQFDDSGDTFCCFLVALFTVVLLPLTYFFWPKPEPRESNESLKKRCQCPPCQVKRNTLRSTTCKKQVKRCAIKTAFLVAWCFLFLLIFKLSKIEGHVPAFDPFLELSIDRDASPAEIKKAYKALSLIHHPDRGGEEQKFIRIYKAYAALTDETAKKNWQEYGNPDGPEAINFGIALPKWMIKKENNFLVVGAYALVFMFILPLVVCLWWYNSMKFSSTKVLLVTVRLFCGSFMYNPFMAMPRLIKLLSCAYEFNSQFNKDIVCRPSDNVELHPLIQQIPAFTIFKKAIVGAPYAIKARALIYAHMLRLDLPPKTLFLDKQYIISHCPRLFEEMINSLLCVLTMAGEESGSRKKMLQLLATIESCMHLVPMLVQALSTSSSPLIQLPHIGPLQLRQISSGKRSVKTVRQLAEMPDDRRRVLMRNLSDEQYRDILNVLAGMPDLELSAHCEVIDDEDSSIWPLSLVTVTVHIVRRPLLNLANLNSSSGTDSRVGAGAGPVASTLVDASTDLRCSKDASWYVGGGDSSEPLYRSISAGGRGALMGDGYPVHFDDKVMDGSMEASSRKPAVPVWDKSKRRKGGAKKGKPRKPTRVQQQHQAQKDKVQPTGKSTTSPNTSEAANGGVVTPAATTISNDTAATSPLSDDAVVPEATDQVEEREDEPEVVMAGDKSTASPEPHNLPDAVKRFEKDAKRREASRRLDARERCTHQVHCPFFPMEKFEGWWVYLIDRKTRQLITKPVFLNSLQTEEELELKFVAPPLPGQFVYTLCVRSDSYVDFDFVHNVPFVVVPLPEHILQSLREAETRGTESSSEDEGDDEEEEEEDDDGYEEDDLDEEMDEDEEDAEDSAESKPRIDIEKLSEYVARA
nr:unnamed protein product [Spirometra erinaceieuropaei]